MLKYLAYILLAVLFADICGAALGGVVHRLEHALLSSDHGIHYQNLMSGSEMPEGHHSHFKIHKHGDTYHTHGSIVTILLSAFELGEENSPSDDARCLLLLHWAMNGFLPDGPDLEKIALPDYSDTSMLTTRWKGIFNLDIPTPPPKLLSFNFRK